jgi:hypothetical protein
MKKSAAHFFCLFFILSFPTSGFAQTAWLGKYEYGESAGKTTGGIVTVIHHEITVKKDGNELPAFIPSQCYQTSKYLKCAAKIVGNRLQIYFLDYGEENLYKPFERGNLLLTLERQRIRWKT